MIPANRVVPNSPGLRVKRQAMYRPLNTEMSRLSDTRPKKIFIGNRFFFGFASARWSGWLDGVVANASGEEFTGDGIKLAAAGSAATACVSGGRGRFTGTTVACFLCSCAMLASHAGGV